ncbi:MAG: cbb3-type cytochrome c oxidase subunit 3 [Deltaproteobacteria bacterium]|nr:cbb3-type cytochrome c oxidase subunit 3 [Deltaproteobacteria bacterium]MBW2422373.1 cbb3-type cytochrome c oxidase subunit 3 [Deltaproteobacteria bacterium]
MEMGALRGYITLATMLAFVGICWWAYRSGNRERFEEDALLPFADEVDTSQSTSGDSDR